MRQQTLNWIKGLVESKSEQSEVILQTLKLVHKPLSNEKPSKLYALISDYFRVKELIQEHIEEKVSSMDIGDISQFEIEHGYYNVNITIAKHTDSYDVPEQDISLSEEAQDLVTK